MNYKKNKDDTNKILLGKILSKINNSSNNLNIQDSEFKVFSQFGEDGIINYLIQKTQIKENERYFIEIGVGDYSECNSKFLLKGSYWQGAAIEANSNHVEKIRSQDYCWKYGLRVVNKWVSLDNINEIIKSSLKDNNLGLLSIDLDGNDYWIWKEINIIKPIIVVIEWNSLFGKNKSLTIPYEKNFIREKKHYSGQYWGASIKAFQELGKSKGYLMVGSNSAGNNLFFVRSDRKGDLKEDKIKDLYVEQIFNDAKNKKGKLTFSNKKNKINDIGNLKLVDLEKNTEVKISDIKEEL